MNSNFFNNCRRVGIFGGTFDPVHVGHIRLAEFILDRSLVDKIIFVPTFQPPHKDAPQASFYHRLAMLELAIKDNGSLAVSDLEANLDTPSYSINTFTRLHDISMGAELFFLMGADSLRDFPYWRDCHKILMLTSLIVVGRSTVPEGTIPRLITSLPGFANSEVNFMADGVNLWHGEGGARLYYLTGFGESVSSSEVRNALLAQENNNMLTQNVASYIKSNKLYGVKT